MRPPALPGGRPWIVQRDPMGAPYGWPGAHSPREWHDLVGRVTGQITRACCPRGITYRLLIGISLRVHSLLEQATHVQLTGD